MAQPPRRPPPPPQRRPPPPLRTEEDDYPPPAVQDNRVIASGGGRLPFVSEQGETYPPPEPVKTIGDEQRERSAYIESIGVEAYKAECDNRTGEEGQPQVEGAQYFETYEQEPEPDFGPRRVNSPQR
jgi:hypothetical protein